MAKKKPKKTKQKATKTKKKPRKKAVKTPKGPKKPKKKQVKKAKRKPVKKAAKRKPTKSTAKKTKKSSASSRKRKVLGIKKKLLSQREVLLREAETALNILPGTINFPDMGDQATAEADRDFMLRLRDRERMLLKKIDEAVERIDNHTFGICESCSNEIGIKRLEARPVTTYCIDCKTRQEEEERIAEGG